MLEISHVSKCYGDKKVLDDVSFTIADGQICAVAVSYRLVENRSYGEPAYDKQALLSYYGQRRDIAKANYEICLGKTPSYIPDEAVFINVDPSYADVFLEEYLTYDYFVKTGTVGYDYVSADYLDMGRAQSLHSSHMLKYGEVVYYILIVLAAVVSVVAVNIDFESGMLKNILSARISRAGVANGKISFTAVCLLFMFLIATVVGICLAIPSASDMSVVFTGKTVFAMPTIVVFISNMVSAFTAMIAISAIAVFFASVFKKAFWGVFSAFALYGMCAGVYFLANYLSPMHNNILLRYIPFLNLQEIEISFANPLYWLHVAIYSITAAALCYGAKKLLVKRDI
jgi:ABC-type transport system involved in multi-copper enzyme maturation permease subunit